MDDMLNKSQSTMIDDQKQLAIQLGQHLKDWGALDIRVLDIEELASWCRYIIIASFTSNTQGLTLVRDAAQFLLSNDVDCNGNKPARDDQSGWFLLDGGSIVVNFFNPEKREFYQLESMWSKGKLLYASEE